ncbi:unnamed protein product [Rhizoctonia solani]|uniref:DUF6535 domain-containing protein n=1 Tax=Rhizoctonia solani TaxID=456999 RepID=A0A8H3CVU9_9AGAM|nr:unnamed protein product [Rhizoctonia solani]
MGSSSLVQQGNRDGIFSANQAPLDFRRRWQFEPMAADRFGEELAPDATIWSVYLEEAQEYDQELVQGRLRSLDTLLLFAALFSAILTAFLIESKDLLQQNSGDASAALLLTIAQSQQRIELGLPVLLGAASPITMPSFEISMTARWVNGIWFMSLGLSLSAALMAMLAKEWLTGYLAFRPRSPRKLAFIRQSRLKGLEDWWALHIIALLPTLLHISLLLFAVGLVIYLWSLEPVVAAVTTGVIGFTSIFYLVTGILGAVYEFCPFVTEISAYTRRIVASLFSPSSRDHHDNGEASAPSIHDLEALLWLANNAQDPVAIDCSYQAMAGLHVSPYLGIGISVPQFDWSRIPVYTIEGKNTFQSLLSSIMKRFDELLKGTLETGGVEPPVGRYVNAMLGLVTRMPKNEIDKPEISLSEIFKKVGKLWQSALPPHSMSGNNFASTLIAEMDIFRLCPLKRQL